ncbi:hypothetical protein BC827DRAFT_507587 [Russula dissimulans]|nr:hypothetical protein BC827DRAFT_507587 [Russula dissimulans]
MALPLPHYCMPSLSSIYSSQTLAHSPSEISSKSGLPFPLHSGSNCHINHPPAAFVSHRYPHSGSIPLLPSNTNPIMMVPTIAMNRSDRAWTVDDAYTPLPFPPWILCSPISTPIFVIHTAISQRVQSHLIPFGHPRGLSWVDVARETRFGRPPLGEEASYVSTFRRLWIWIIDRPRIFYSFTKRGRWASTFYTSVRGPLFSPTPCPFGSYLIPAGRL